MFFNTFEPKRLQKNRVNSKIYALNYNIIIIINNRAYIHYFRFINPFEHSANNQEIIYIVKYL